ncbi:M14 family metallopeptidase [Clostridium tagluense]|uniref:M14 family metallopeptidase n=1 Tax=Clostridium tagluense TaxID=360422 RepID=UPI001C0C9202|nr:M14 family metallopeptidase [Clostridium tagluense]MBU3127262.1 peptidoglycan-binding protein [Clostridium tagluense]MCB2312264.1 M14 family metallopeptidase [Clostridium tagluense]MCB2316998.1 M14 family metallopeptidase [Clostridium tagluense]MCB2321802.1 M14 family metallopeptidase [Clostridium tagluense]MCB2326777.1 M14 family metallopeptidase [Clostridium tagluense]
MQILKIGSRGTEVMEIQALLNKLGYSVDGIDGIYGLKTAAAVSMFQRYFGLLPTGVVNDDTYKLMNRFLMGYDTYRIRPGDTLYLIARRYYTTPLSIITANPQINPNNLKVGSEIIVPYSLEVVYTNIDYTYDIMKKDLEGLKARYPFIEVASAGKSELGKELYYVKLGNGPNKVFYNGSHHAIEWITTVLLMKFIENFSKAYATGQNLEGYNVQDIWNKSSIYVMPMVNPDGVDLVLNGLDRSNPYYNDLIKWNNGSTDFSKTWSANIRGVDLNHNYDALWLESKEAEKSYGVYGPGPTRYSGTSPESESESKALADFTRKNNFRLVIAYHSQGEVIYWDFENLASPEARKIGEIFSKLSGYELAETYGITSFAGYKDWFIDKYRKPGYTIEVGLGENPLPISQFNKIYKDNIKVLLEGALV